MSQLVDTSTLEIRPFTEADLAQVQAIEARVYPDPWSPQLIGESLQAPMTHCMAVFQGGEVQAYAIYQVIFTEAHLLNIAVHPDWQNRGFGRTLLRDVMEKSLDLGAISFFLEVRPSNAVAIKLYEKEGFRKLMVREKYYSNGEDAIIMMAEL